MYDDSYEDEYLKGTPDTGWGIFVCILLTIIAGIFLAGCTKVPNVNESRTVQISEKTLNRQIAACSQNEGVQYWMVTVKGAYIEKTMIVCNNGMIKEFQPKDM